MSAVWPIEVALVERLLLDAPLRALLGSTREAVFSDGMVPKDYPVPLVVVGDNTEGHADTFTRAGYDTTHSLHLWAPDKEVAQALYARLEILLHLQPVGVEGHVVVRGELSQPVSVWSEPDRAWHILARYAVLTHSLVRKP